MGEASPRRDDDRARGRREDAEADRGRGTGMVTSHAPSTEALRGLRHGGSGPRVLQRVSANGLGQRHLQDEHGGASSLGCAGQGGSWRALPDPRSGLHHDRGRRGPHHPRRGGRCSSRPGQWSGGVCSVPRREDAARSGSRSSKTTTSDQAAGALDHHMTHPSTPAPTPCLGYGKSLHNPRCTGSGVLRLGHSLGDSPSIQGRCA